MAQIRTRHRQKLFQWMGARQVSPAIWALMIAVVALAGIGVSRSVIQDGFEISRDAASTSALDNEERESDANTNSAPDKAADQATSEEAAPEVVEIVVHVDGAVEAPGVYRLTGTSIRVGDAVEDAGGLAEDADTTSLNLAAPLEDGQKVYVPHVGETQEVIQPTNPSASPQGATTSSPGVVNINTATAEELETLPGIGEATARAIIEERENGGPFSCPEDIMRVSGIGEKKYARLQGLIDV